MALFYNQYDHEIDIKTSVPRSEMTVKELKEYKGLKTGIWSTPKNNFYIQTYKVELFDRTEKKWILLSENEILNFSNQVHRIKIYLA